MLRKDLSMVSFACWGLFNSWDFVLYCESWAWRVKGGALPEPYGVWDLEYNILSLVVSKWSTSQRRDLLGYSQTPEYRGQFREWIFYLFHSCICMDSTECSTCCLLRTFLIQILLLNSSIFTLEISCGQDVEIIDWTKKCILLEYYMPEKSQWNPLGKITHPRLKPAASCFLSAFLKLWWCKKYLEHEAKTMQPEPVGEPKLEWWWPWTAELIWCTASRGVCKTGNTPESPEFPWIWFWSQGVDTSIKRLIKNARHKVDTETFCTASCKWA